MLDRDDRRKLYNELSMLVLPRHGPDDDGLLHHLNRRHVHLPRRLFFIRNDWAEPRRNVLRLHRRQLCSERREHVHAVLCRHLLDGRRRPEPRHEPVLQPLHRLDLLARRG